MAPSSSESKNNSSKKPAETYLLHTGFLFHLFFDPEDGGDMFFRNVD
jgi:hypothetical protein